MNSKHRKKLACFALAGTVAVSSLMSLTPSASAANKYNDPNAVTYSVDRATGQRLTDEEGAALKAAQDASWYDLVCDSYTNKTLYVPIGGTVQNGSTYEDADGNLRATEGSTILNRYGVDVTSVDSEMSDYEKEIAKAIYDNCGGKYQITFAQTKQMIAEMRLLEVKQNMANIEATGYADQIRADTSEVYNVGSGVTCYLYRALLYTRPDVTAKLLEISKTPSPVYEVNPTTAATRADMAYFLMQYKSQVNPDAAATAEASAMSDVQSGAWYAEAAKYCQEHGLMGGVGNGKFDPEGTVTRGQLATVIYRLAGSPAVDLSENPFTDVQSDEYYATAVEWCRQNKIINGTSDTTFAPDNAVTRQDMAVMFRRYIRDALLMYRQASPKQYSDWSGVAEYAEDAVKWAAEFDLLQMNSTAAAAKSYEELIAEFTQYKFSENYNNGSRFTSQLYGMSFKYVTESAGIDWGQSYGAGGAEGAIFSRYDGWRTHEFTKQYDHTPTLEELAKDIYIGLGGGNAMAGFSSYVYAYSSSIGIAFDASTNTVVAVC